MSSKLPRTPWSSASPDPRHGTSEQPRHLHAGVTGDGLRTPTEIPFPKGSILHTPLPKSLVVLVAAAVLCVMVMARMVRETTATLRAHDADIRAEHQSEAD